MKDSERDQLRDKLMGLGKQSMRKNYYADLRKELDQRIEAEMALKQLNDNLERLVETRTQALLEMEKQLIQAEKLASLGSLVAGISHEVNTPLGISVTVASHLKSLVDRLKQVPTNPNSPHSSVLGEMEEALWILENNLARSVDIMENLKRIAVDQHDDFPQTVDFISYSKGILKSLRPELKRRGIQTAVSGDSTCFQVSYPGIWSQILVNLVKNSIIHGFEEKEAGQSLLQNPDVEKLITLAFKCTPQGIYCTYTDNGTGMTDDVAKQLFDPFFTTKRGSGGTGLGMFIVHQLITEHLKGTIQYLGPVQYLGPADDQDATDNAAVKGQLGVKFEIFIPKM